jgi:hypothetical protein
MNRRKGVDKVEVRQSVGLGPASSLARSVFVGKVVNPRFNSNAVSTPAILVLAASGGQSDIGRTIQHRQRHYYWKLLPESNFLSGIPLVVVGKRLERVDRRTPRRIVSWSMFESPQQMQYRHHPIDAMWPWVAVSGRSFFS